jgi:hypothetical protein
VASNNQTSSMSRNYLIGILVPIVLVAAIGTTLALRSSTPKASPTKALCTALANIAAYGKAHPPKRTYPDLKATLTYDHAQFASVKVAPAAIAGPASTATTSSAALLADIATIQSKVKMSKAALNAAITNIKTWKKANASLSTWQKATCK